MTTSHDTRGSSKINNGSDEESSHSKIFIPKTTKHIYHIPYTHSHMAILQSMKAARGKHSHFIYIPTKELEAALIMPGSVVEVKAAGPGLIEIKHVREKAE